MKIFVKVKSRNKKEKVEKIAKDKYQVCLNALPIKGRANKRLIELISGYFKVSKSQVEILSGLTSKNKILKIDKN